MMKKILILICNYFVNFIDKTNENTKEVAPDFGIFVISGAVTWIIIFSNLILILKNISAHQILPLFLLCIALNFYAIRCMHSCVKILLIKLGKYQFMQIKFIWALLFFWIYNTVMIIFA